MGGGACSRDHVGGGRQGVPVCLVCVCGVCGSLRCPAGSGYAPEFGLRLEVLPRPLLPPTPPHPPLPPVRLSRFCRCTWSDGRNHRLWKHTDVRSDPGLVHPREGSDVFLNLSRSPCVTRRDRGVGGLLGGCCHRGSVKTYVNTEVPCPTPRGQLTERAEDAHGTHTRCPHAATCRGNQARGK